MPELQRITCEYSEPEDRIRLIGEPVQALALDSSNEPKQVIVLWLSQRLLSRLVSNLCKHLEMENISALQAEIQQTFCTAGCDGGARAAAAGQRVGGEWQ